MKAFIAAHRRPFWIAGGLAAAGIVFVLVWFQPHKLFIEQTVNEAVPQAEAMAGAMAAAGGVAGMTDGSEMDASPTTLLSGTFQRLEHPTSGTASIIELADGRRFLRFEDLDTSNGPDLRVYLSEIPESDDWFAYGERFVDLGALKGNRGDQNYALPEGLDLSRFKSAVIWCRRFTVGFGVAGLEEA